MPRGYLEIILGPMFSGKTTALINRVEAYCNKHQAYKLKFDDRYSQSKIKTHDGKGISATNIKSQEDFDVDFEKTQIVAIDEIQFFEKPNFKGDIIETINKILDGGVHVVCSGLDLTWQNKEFAISSKLMQIADKITMLEAKCAICGKPASKTFKKSGSDKQIELGSEDVYEPRCDEHFFAFSHDEYENTSDIIIPLKNRFHSRKFDLLSLPRERKNYSGIIPIVPDN